jgi:hypothetical protein
MPLSKVKEKEFLSRPMGCKGIGFSFVRCKPGEGATYVHRHKVQEEVFIALKGDGTIILDGKRIKMPEGRPGRPDGLAGAGKRLKIRRCLYGFGRRPAEELSPGRKDPFGRRDSQSKKGTALEESVKEIGRAEC